MSRSPEPWSRLWRFHAAWGTVGVAALYALRPFEGLRALGGIGYLLAFAALVIVPLGASLAAMRWRDGTTAWVYRAAAVLHPLAAAAGVAALLMPAGFGAGLVARVWLIETLLLAFFGLHRLAGHGVVCLDELALDVALLQLPVGGFWWVATCEGWRLGFSDLIVQLTAIHFHYAGFAAPAVCGLAGRGIDPARRLARGLYRAAGATVLPAVWIVAVGIAVSPMAELAGAVLLAGGMLLLAALLCFELPRLSGPAAGALLAFAGLSLALPMALAVAYAAGELAGRTLVTIPAMARWHGLWNAFGFAFAGLLAFAIRRPPSRCAAPYPTFSRVAGRWRIGADFFDRRGLVDPGRRPAGLVDDLGEYRREGFDPDRVDPTIRRFYERTAEYALDVEVRWSFGFRLAGRVLRRVTAAIGQLNLPLGRIEESRMESRLVAIRDERDGRRSVRAWIRTYADTGQPVYVAAYSVHRSRVERSVGVPYMSIAFPLPGGNLASLLRMDPVAGCPGSLCLTTRPAGGVHGDEGVFYANRRLPIRLPLDETVRVWPRREAPEDLVRRFEGLPAGAALARHDMWLLGLRYLTIDYLLTPKGAV